MANVVEILIQAKDLAKDKITGVKNSLLSMGREAGKQSGNVNKLDRASRQAATGQKDLSSKTNELTTTLKRAAAGFTAFIAAAFGLHKIKQGLVAILDTGGKFEILNTQLAAIMGTVEGGQAAFAWIQDFAKKTPLQLEGVTDAFIKMKAFGLDPMDGTMQNLVDVSSKLGGGQERLNGIILAVGQAWTKQKLQAEEVNQLIERGVPVWDLLSEALGKTTGELQEMSKNGEIGREQISLLIDEIGRSSEGAAAAQMQTWTGIISNLQDTWSQFLDSIAQSGALEYFKGQLTELSDHIKGMAADGSLKELAVSISDGFISAAQTTRSFIENVISLKDQLYILGKAFVAVKVVQFAAGFTKLTAGITTSTIAAKGLTAGLVGIKASAAVLTFTISQVISLGEKLIEAGRAARVFKDAQKELSENTKYRLQFLEQEAVQLGINTAQYKGNITAIVDAIQAKKDETKETIKATAATRDFDAEVAAVAASSEKASAQVEALAQKTGLTNSEVIRLTGSTQKIISQFHDWENSADGLAEGLQSVSDTDLTAMIHDMTAAIESGVNATDRMKLSLNLLAQESLRRMGIELDLLIPKIDDFGIKGAANFAAVKESANLTEAQLEQLRIELIKLAETPEQLKELKNEFQKQGEVLTGTTAAAKAYNQQLDILKAKTNDTARVTRGLGSAYAGMSSQARSALAPLHDEMDRLRQEAAALRNELNQAVNTANRTTIGSGFNPKTQERVNSLSPEEFAKFKASFERIANSNTSKSNDQIVNSILFGIEKNREKGDKKKDPTNERPSINKQVTIQFDDPRGNTHRTRFDSEEEGDNFIRMMQDIGTVTG